MVKNTKLFAKKNKISGSIRMQRFLIVACAFISILFCSHSYVMADNVEESDTVSEKSIPVIVINDKEDVQEEQEEKIEPTVELEIQIPKKENKIYYAIDEGKLFYLDAMYQDFLWEELKKYNCTDLYELCLAVSLHESHFNINCISSTNDHGLMQINGGNEKWLKKALGINSLDDPFDNIRCGVYMLSSYYNEYNDVESSLVCYNQGYVGGVKSTSYSKCVLSDMSKLHVME